jgi:class 3 adenylate cyclase
MLPRRTTFHVEMRSLQWFPPAAGADSAAPVGCAPMPAWYFVVTDPAVLRRAAITGLGVGTLLTAINHGPALLAGSLPASAPAQIVLSYVIPFLVSLASSVIAIRVERRDSTAATDLLEREIDAINRFPGQNPNPVLRMTEAGHLTYANASSAPIRSALGVDVGAQLPAATVAALIAAAAARPPGTVELTHERQTFAVLPVHVPELGVYNLYGTDVTGAKVVERFPDRNPNPVLRMTPDGALWYGNAASAPIRRALGVEIGDPLPPEVLESLHAALDRHDAPPVEVAGEGRTFRLTPVPIPEFDFTNLYGTDITAQKAVDKFPNENPNPVLRLTRDGHMTYANPASVLVRKALGAEVGDTLSPEVLARIDAALVDGASGEVELEADGRTFAVRVVHVYEFDSINLYGTDITAARQVEAFSRENERLLLNILPPSIADRLRGGETVIADRFEDMAVLFADVVGFTELSARLAPTDVVGLLNEVFSTCDRLADRFGLEKIKTIGDAYMVVGGLDHDGDEADHHRRATHAGDVADMGLAILDELGRLRHEAGIGLQVRVGMHVGPAVAGVIGLKKFIYDVWGDTVNTASRMESTGVPGRLQVTRETRDRLDGAFELERRGIVEVKGKGPIETWFLVGRKVAAATAAASGSAGR